MLNDETERVLDAQDPDTTTAAEPAPGSELDQLRQELAQTRETAEQFRAKYLRSEADMQNYRKAVDRQRLEGERAFRRSTLGRFLPIIDNLDRALAQAERGVNLEALLEGIQLTRRGMLDLLTAEGVQPMSAAGQPFNPHYHEAVSTVPGLPGTAPNTVVAETEQGYLLDGVVLRPARVVVTGE